MKNESKPARTAAAVLAAAYIFYGLIVFVTAPEVSRYAGGLPLFDLRPLGYSAAEADSLLSALGPAGRAAYASRQLPLDFFYPSLFGLGFFLLFRAWLEPGRRYRRLALAWPLLAGGFDLLENSAILALLKTYPAVPSGLVIIASSSTLIKSLAATATYVLFLTLLWRRLKNKKN